MPRPYRIGVVGFGVGGGTSAVLLARQGHTVELFERTRRVGPAGAGVLLMPSGQLALKAIGWHDAVVAMGSPIEALDVHKHPTGQLLRMPFDAAGPGLRAYGLHRGDLFEFIHREVDAQGVAVHLDHDVQGYRVESDRVLLRDQHGREHGPFDFVISADGSRSVLRDHADLVRYRYPYRWGALWYIGPSTAVQGRLHQVVRGTRNLVGLLPMGGGRLTLFFGIRNDQKDAVWRGGVPAWKAEVLTLAPLAEELLQGLTDFDQVVHTTYQAVWLKRWHTNHVLFLGDAAHAMSPHLGQGLNLALIDAWTFAHCLERASTPRHAFSAYDDARRAHLRYYSLATFAMSPFFQADGWLKGLLRNAGLPLMARIPWLRKQMGLTMAGLKAGFLGGRIRLPGAEL